MSVRGGRVGGEVEVSGRGMQSWGLRILCSIECGGGGSRVGRFGAFVVGM